MTQIISDKTTVQIIVQQCIKLGLKDVVISPGSRNAPLTLSFSAAEDINSYVIVDERSAGFFALGMAQQLKRPVAIICTSGSAALNYAPAIAEAYYQEVPLLVITADRPSEWIEQADGQTINQTNLFANYIRHSVNLPTTINHSDEQCYVERAIAEAYYNCTAPIAGAVHINVPLREPLYNSTNTPLPLREPFRNIVPNASLSESTLNDLASTWNNANSVMVLAGMLSPCSKLNSIINNISTLPNTVVLSETTSNLSGKNIIGSTDRFLAVCNNIQPELLITFGGQIISKKIKARLRKCSNIIHWHIAPNPNAVDTFQHLSLSIKMIAVDFFEQIFPKLSENSSTYSSQCIAANNKGLALHNKYVANIPWCDMKALDHIFKNIPEHFSVQLANSTPIRYAQLFQHAINNSTFANRGTSGIDGSVSTAVGASQVLNEPCILISGDLSFFYDSNGLWNNYLKPDFKIVVINNGGGEIFNFISDSSNTDMLNKYFVAKHNNSVKNIALAFGLKYLSCSNADELKSSFSQLINTNNAPTLLEVFTHNAENSNVLKEYFKHLE